MKVQERTKRLSDGVTIEVVRAIHNGAYRLRIAFSDGHETEVDFEPFLRSSSNPQIREFLDRSRFASFRVDSGDLIWGDYELCFPLVDLYEARV